MYDSYPLQGQAGQQVEITLESTDFDTYLILVGPDGNVVAQNDDANQSNAALTLTLPVSGTYTIIANSYDRSLGRYRLVVSTPDQAAARPVISQSCQSAVNAALSHLRGINNLQVSTRTSDVSRGYPDYPSGRPEGYIFMMQGTAIESVMSSSQLLTNLSTSIIQNCGTVSKVTFARANSGWRVSFGLFPDNQVKVFECAEDFGIEPGRGNSNRATWGMDYCSL